MVIAIGRQFGSGGRELGQLLARRLGIGYYDKELLLQAAKQAGVSPEFFEQRDERFPTGLGGLFSFTMGCSPACYYTGASAIGADGLYQAIGEFLLREARERSFVVVGRSADYVLRHDPGLVSVFVHAPMEMCVERIRRRQPELSPRQARGLAEKTNRCRAEYYNFFTDRTWGDAATYDLCLDSSAMPMDALAQVVELFAKNKCAAAQH